MGATFSTLVPSSSALNERLRSWLPGITAKKMAVASLCTAVPLIFTYLGLRLTGRAKGKDFTKGKGKDGFERSGSRLDVDLASIASGTTSTESSLLKKHTLTQSITTSIATYPAIRLFYREHPKQKSLPTTLPLIVFVHGLGGQLAQFQYLIDYFVHISHVLGIDLPGCGASAFSPKDPSVYTTEALVAILENVIPKYLQPDQQFVLIGHSMGCAVSCSLLQPNRPLTSRCAGLVAICPKAELSEHERSQFKKALMMPEPIFDLWRLYDRRGGVDSASVRRFVGKSASKKVRAMQVRFNEESRTPVWRRMVKGFSLPSSEDWTKVECPVYLLGAAEDTVCPVSEVDKIYEWLSGETKKGVEKAVIPSAGHSLIFEAPQVTSKLVGEFLKTHVREELDLGWQLSYLKEDKWMLKNLTKWTNFVPVGDRVGNSRFRPMKTLRENDAVHNPADFAKTYPEIGHIIDISHESPPYEPASLGPLIKYHKFPTVSKIPPMLSEVRQFIDIVDGILENLPENAERPMIAVHCHYGFNRTGFFLVSYLIERCGYDVPGAIEEFRKAREPGIRHPHFKNELYQRYSMGGPVMN